jgi:phenylpyruvate tautomerase PptA (4-oxalocrotonate tautomerase family)
MPHLQIDINKTLADDAKIEILTRFKALFAEVMGTKTDHIATAIREHATHNLDIGRANDRSDGVAHVNADIRVGRSIEQRRALALGFIDALHELAHVPRENLYVTFTEHKGEDFHLSEQYLRSWEPGEDPLG